jgi:acetyltransferase EpsM
MGSKQIHLIGAGSLGLQAADILLAAGQQGEILAYDDNTSLHSSELLPGVFIQGGIDLVGKLDPGSMVAIAIADTAVRQRIYSNLRQKGYKFPNVVHPAAVISKFAHIGFGNIIFPGVVIDPAATVGNFVVLNKNSSVGHNAILEDFITITPNCTLTCPVDSGVFIGMGARLLPGSRVGENSIIGAGAVVNKPIPANVIAIGVPAKIKEKGMIK